MTTLQAQRLAERLAVVDCLGHVIVPDLASWLMTLSEAEQLAAAIARTDSWLPVALLAHTLPPSASDPARRFTLNIRACETCATAEVFNGEWAACFIAGMRQPAYPGYGR